MLSVHTSSPEWCPHAHHAGRRFHADVSKAPGRGYSHSARDPLLVFSLPCHRKGASLEARMGKNPPAMWETRVPSLDQKDPLEKGMATHSSILAWRFPHRGLAGYSPLVRRESDTTEQLTLSLQIRGSDVGVTHPVVQFLRLRPASQQHGRVCLQKLLCPPHSSQPRLEADTPPLNISCQPRGDSFFMERLCCS